MITFQTLRIGDIHFSNGRVVVVVLRMPQIFSLDRHDGVDDGAVRQKVDDSLSVVLKAVFGAAKEATEPLSTESLAF